MASTEAQETEYRETPADIFETERRIRDYAGAIKEVSKDEFKQFVAAALVDIARNVSAIHLGQLKVWKAMSVDRPKSDPDGA